MSRFGLWTVLILLTSQQAFAAMTQAELAKRLQFYEDITTLDVEFEQVKTLKDLKVKLESKGRLKLVRPDQVTWEIFDPSRVLIEFKNKEIRLESGEGAERTIQKWNINDIQNGKDSKSINALMPWLQLDAAELAKLYVVSSLSASKLSFVPKDKDQSAFSSIEITLADAGRLDLLHIQESSGDEMDIQFKVPTTKTQRR